MPRDLSDVLHYFMPELESGPDGTPDRGVPDPAPPRSPAPAAPSASRFPSASPSATVGRSAPASARRADRGERPVERGAAGRRRRFGPLETGHRGTGADEPGLASRGRLPLSILGLPFDERELVHAAVAASLAAETARQGGASVLLVLEEDRERALWPLDGAAEVGVEVVACAARSATELARTAGAIAESRGLQAARGGIVFTRVPPVWLQSARVPIDPIRWFLVFAARGDRDATRVVERLRQLRSLQPASDVGIAMPTGAGDEGTGAPFDELARRCESELGWLPARYGPLERDLELDRAIAGGRIPTPVDRSSAAGRAIARVTAMLYEDARSRLLG